MSKIYTQKDLDKVKNLVDNAKAILILAPDSQDGDSVSANLALKVCFESMKKKVYWVSEKGSNPLFDHLLGNDACAGKKSLKNLENKVDLVVLADLGSRAQIEKSLENNQWILNKPSIIFDHHSNREKGVFSVELVDHTAAATGLLLAEIYPKLKWTITPKIATYMLAGIYSDTGSFSNLNTNTRVFEIASRLARLGADPAKLSQDYLISSGLTHAELKVYSKILAKVEIKDHVAFALINYEDIKDLTNSDISHRVGDIIRYMKSVRISFVVSEKMPNKFYLSLRSLDGYDVAQIAKELGGGGHKVAAGAKFDNSFQSINQAKDATLKLAIIEANKNIDENKK